MAQKCQPDAMDFPHLREAKNMFGDQQNKLTTRGSGFILMKEVCPDCGFDRAEAMVHGLWVENSASCLNCSERFNISQRPSKEELKEMEVDR